MPTLADLLFYLNIALFFAHELDAIQRREWRFFPFLRPLSDSAAFQLFTAAHIPITLLILWLLPIREFQLAFNGFLIVHAVLHFLLRNHPLLDFNRAFSRLWIYTPVPLSLLHLLLLS
ncbi:MAG: hypothetical protein JNM70_23190 [Anaerolineae bacterium]|nr:hypothetical protein [Anaerolineae bacterium]